MAERQDLPRIAVAQLGARMHYAVPRIFHEAGMLERLFTDSYVGNKPWLEAGLRAIPRRVRPRAVDRWLGRCGTGIPPEKVTSFDGLGIRYAAARRFSRATESTDRVFAQYNHHFNELVVSTCPKDANTVYASNGAALELFQWANGRGLRCILEQTMAPWRSYARLMNAELDRWPDSHPQPVIPNDANPILSREEAEWKLATKILCGSSFVVDELANCGAPVDRCTIVPYGVDLARFPRSRQNRRFSDRLRILFVGEVGLRKGAPYLLEAARRLGHANVDVRFVGNLALNRSWLAPYEGVATFLGAVPRSHMPKIYRWADVLVLPSVCEGSATVIYEALAAGVPVICSHNAGAPPEDGILVLDNPEAIIEHAPKLRTTVCDLAHGLARAPKESISTAAYGNRLLASLKMHGPSATTQIVRPTQE